MKEKTEPMKIGVRRISDDPGKPEKEDPSKKIRWRLNLGLDAEDLTAIGITFVYMGIALLLAITAGLMLRLFLWTSGINPEW